MTQRMHDRIIQIAFLVAIALLCLAAVNARAGNDWKQVPDPDALMLEETFALDANPRLHVDVSDVHIELVQTDGNTATVKVYATARNRDKARDYFEDLHMKVVKDENTLKVQTSHSMFRVSVSWHDSPRVRVYAIISVPRGTEMRVKTDDGDIRAARLVGDLDARTSDGSIVVDDIEARSVRVKTSDGDVKFDKIRADQVDANSSDGNVRVGDVAGKELSFSTSDGDVIIGKASADDVYLSTSDGDVTVEQLDGARMRGRTSDGDIDVTLTGATALDLRTSDGNIRIGAPRGLGADVNLKGEHVRLAGDIEIDGDISRGRARGKIGGGGVEIVARTSDGNVSLEQDR